MKNNWEKYYKGISEDIDYYFPQEDLVEAVTTFLKKDINNSKILELGCGKGLESMELEKRGADVTVVDYSETAVNSFKKRCVDSGVEIDVIQQDITSLNIPDRRFDLIFSSGVLEHFHNPDEIVKKQFELLENNGILIVDVPNKYTLYTVIKKILMKLNLWNAGWETEYSPKDLENLLKRNNFSIVDVFGRDLLLFKIVRKIKKKLKVKDRAEGRIKKWFRKKMCRNGLFLNFLFINVTVIGEKS